MRAGVEHELHALPWRTDRPGAHVARAAAYVCAIQAEAGFACPITMTFAAVPALRVQPELADELNMKRREVIAKCMEMSVPITNIGKVFMIGPLRFSHTDR